MPIIIRASHGETLPLLARLVLTNAVELGQTLTNCHYEVGVGTHTDPPTSWTTPETVTEVSPTEVTLAQRVGATVLVAPVGDDWLWVRVTRPDGTQQLVRIDQEQLEVL